MDEVKNKQTHPLYPLTADKEAVAVATRTSLMGVWQMVLTGMPHSKDKRAAQPHTNLSNQRLMSAAL